MEDFEAALAEIKPAFGAVTETLAAYCLNGIIDFGAPFRHLRATCQTLVEQARRPRGGARPDRVLASVLPESAGLGAPVRRPRTPYQTLAEQARRPWGAWAWLGAGVGAVSELQGLGRRSAARATPARRSPSSRGRPVASSLTWRWLLGWVFNAVGMPGMSQWAMGHSPRSLAAAGRYMQQAERRPPLRKAAAHARGGGCAGAQQRAHAAADGAAGGPGRRGQDCAGGHAGPGERVPVRQGGQRGLHGRLQRAGQGRADRQGV